ncbi:MAG TPA: THUMP domain-containing protein [Candidatus Krumholzibacteria bacterium]|nr:THUMP domain-containing protein [Candidatus Krumholzibacteria bacterium]HPD72871.1 THUMP domain-containing protein [Candidatus Krumholzibacteria bacterium]HRY41670.1 THUMP domain-containing protein [Candidatus Krumholzibacteria bacterium]
MYRYQDDPRYFAQVSGGVEDLAATELQALGATDVEAAVRGLHFRADPRGVYRVVYASQLVQRVIAPLAHFRCHTPDYLYRKVREIDWRDFLRPGQTFAVFANVSHSQLKDSRFAALRVKDAVCDRLRDDTGKRPDIDTENPDLWISLHAAHDAVTLGVDLGGGSLHKRGYRKQTVEAPMQETVAAAIVALSGWTGDRPLHDPMCGSGTLLAEAWLRATGTPAGTLRRRFGFMQLPDFDIVAWKQVKKGLDSRRRLREPGVVSGGDIDAKAVAAARANLALLPGGDRVPIRRRDFRDAHDLRDAVIVCNPPYGIRLATGSDLAAFYKDLGDWLKVRCAGCEAYVYFGERELLKSIGLRPAWRRPLRNGGLDGRLAKFELYT